MDELRLFKVSRVVIILATFFIAVAFLAGSISLYTLSLTNDNLNTRLACRAEASDKMFAAQARGLAAVASGDDYNLRIQAMRMLDATQELEECSAASEG